MKYFLSFCNFWVNNTLIAALIPLQLSQGSLNKIESAVNLKNINEIF